MTFTLAHLSDAHIGPLPPARWRELISKRLTGYVNWHRGRHGLHNMDVLRALVADLHQQQPDHIAMTGDILNIGLESEFAPARAWLEQLGSPERVSFVPGNHDVYVPRNIGDVARTFGPWMGAQGRFPYLHRRGPLALIGLNSGVPTGPFMAYGRLDGGQLNELAAILSDPSLRDVARVVMIHHPPYGSGRGIKRGLENSAAFETVVAEHGAELVLHGHNHRRQVYGLASKQGVVPIVGVNSCSAVPGSPRHLAAYHLFAFARQENGWLIRAKARGAHDGQAGVHDLGEIVLPGLASVSAGR